MNLKENVVVNVASTECDQRPQGAFIDDTPPNQYAPCGFFLRSFI